MSPIGDADVGDRATPRANGRASDPSELTDRAIAKAIAAMRDYVDGQFGIRDERLRAIESKAADWNVTVRDTSISGHIDEKVGRLADVVTEKFEGVATRFVEREKATDARFTAQKEAAAAQETSNRAAIDKSERGTAEAIGKLEQLFKTTTDALRDKIDDVKTTANATVQQKVGGTENRTATYALIGVLGTVIAIVVGVVSFALANTP